MAGGHRVGLITTFAPSHPKFTNMAKSIRPLLARKLAARETAKKGEAVLTDSVGGAAAAETPKPRKPNTKTPKSNG